MYSKLIIQAFFLVKCLESYTGSSFVQGINFQHCPSEMRNEAY